jgi:hypothetical protein
MSLLTNLISYYKMDEASGNLLDAHGSNTLTETAGSAGAETGLINGGRRFGNGANNYATIADNASVSTGDIDFSIQAWVKFDSLVGGTFQVIAGRWPNEYLLYWQDFGGAGTNRFVFQFGSGSVTATTFGAPSTGTWYHVIGWHDSVNNQLGISINTTADTASYSSGASDTGVNFTLGRNDDGGGGNLIATLDEVGFWKRVLTSGERTSLYNSGSGLSYDSFGGGAGLVGPLVRHGHLIGSPLVGGRLIRTAA